MTKKEATGTLGLALSSIEVTINKVIIQTAEAINHHILEAMDEEREAVHQDMEEIVIHQGAIESGLIMVHQSLIDQVEEEVVVREETITEIIIQEHATTVAMKVTFQKTAASLASKEMIEEIDQ